MGRLQTGITFTGADKVLRKLNDLEQKLPQEISKQVYRLALDIMADARNRAPVDTGVLRRSGYVLPIRGIRDGNIKVTMGFGGLAEKYAIVQHNTEWYNHAVGEAFFLSNAIEAATNTSARWKDMVYASIRKFL